MKQSKTPKIELDHLSESELQVRQAAIMRVDGLSQQAIASELDVSQATVSRLLGQAEESDILMTVYGPSEEEDEMRSRVYGIRDAQQTLQQLTDLLGLPMPDIHIPLHASPSRPDDASPSKRSDRQKEKYKAFDEAVKAWGAHVAPRVGELIAELDEKDVLGVAWGRHLYACIENLQGLRQIRKRKKGQGPTIVPLWPPRLTLQRQPLDSTVFGNQWTLSANALAQDLHEVFYGPEGPEGVDEYLLPGFDFVPFTKATGTFAEDIRPEGSTADAWKKEADFLEGIRGLMDECPPYQKVFSGAQPMVKRMTACLLSGGPAGTPRSNTPSHNYGGVPWEWFRLHSYGDYGGAVLGRVAIESKKDIPKTPAQCQFNRLLRHFLGLTEEMLADVAIKARAEGSPGCICLMIGPERMPICLEIILRGLANTILMDNTLANALTRRARQIIARCVEPVFAAIMKEEQGRSPDRMAWWNTIKESYLNKPHHEPTDFQSIAILKKAGGFDVAKRAVEDLEGRLRAINAAIVLEGQGLMEMRKKGDDSAFQDPPLALI